MNSIRPGQAMLNLYLGGQSYEIPVLTALKARVWREQLIVSARSISEKLFSKTNGHDENFFSGLGVAFLEFPDKLAELVFAYAPELSKDEILPKTTDEELVLAFATIMKAAVPFLRQLSLMVSFDMAAAMDEPAL